MGLDTWSTSTLRRNLSEMQGYLHEAFVDRASNSPVLRDRGETQYPILAKVVSILREELQGRGADAEEQERLGCTIAEIEQQEADWAAEVEAKHREVLYGRETSYKAQEGIKKALAEEQATGGSMFQGGDPLTTLHVTEAPQSIPLSMLDAVEASMRRIFANTLGEYMELWYKKHHDYGPENHAIWGAQGVVIRLTDKLMRLKGFHFDDREMLTDTLQDTWMDIVGYALIGLVIERGQWPALKLHTAIETMKAEYEDKAFAHVMRDMEAKAGPLPKPPLQCPECQSPDVHLYRDPHATGYEWTYCGMKCRSCLIKIGGHMHFAAGETLDTAVRRAIDEWKESRQREQCDHE